MSKRKAAKPEETKQSPAKKLKESKDKEHNEHKEHKEHTHAPTPWDDLIRSTTLKELCKHKRKLIVLSDNARLEDAMRVLSKNNILSVPVVNEEKKQFYGKKDDKDKRNEKEENEQQNRYENKQKPKQSVIFLLFFRFSNEFKVSLMFWILLDSF